MRLDRLLWTLPASTVLCALRALAHDIPAAMPGVPAQDPWEHTDPGAVDRAALADAQTIVMPAIRGGVR